MTIARVIVHLIHFCKRNVIDNETVTIFDNWEKVRHETDIFNLPAAKLYL